jgi:hypothetical protein
LIEEMFLNAEVCEVGAVNQRCGRRRLHIACFSIGVPQATDELGGRNAEFFEFRRQNVGIVEYPREVVKVYYGTSRSLKDL